MRKIVLSLMLLAFALCAGAQKYKVVHISGGECMVNTGQGWSKLSVNTTLERHAVLKNMSKPLSEVMLREDGTQNTYKVYMLAEQFNLGRFVTDKAKDKPSGELTKFSGFIKDMVTSSQAVTVNVQYDREVGTTHRDASSSFVYKTDDFVRCIAKQAGGVLEFSQPMSLSSELIVTMDYDGENITLTNYGGETANCYILAVRDMYRELIPVPAIDNACVVVPAGTEMKLAYKMSAEDKRLVLIASEEVARFSTELISEYIISLMGKHEDGITVMGKELPFCISIL